MFKTFSPSDWIQIFSIFASLAVLIISVCIALKSLNRAEKSAKATEIANFNATRPYVTIYSNSLDTGLLAIHKYLIIKNFGKTAAKVKTIDFNGELDEINKERKLRSLHDFVLAPGMSVRTVISANFSKTIMFQVTYSDLENNQFKEDYKVNFGFSDDLVFAKASAEANDEVKAEINRLPKGYVEVISALNVIAQQLQN